MLPLMTNTELAGRDEMLTPRQDRIEAAIVAALCAGCTRSTLRALVEQFSDHARLRGMPLDDSLAHLKAISLRSGPALVADSVAIVGESLADRITMMARWLRARYLRAD